MSLKDCLARAAFLLLLATGWRISELHACVRLSTYCSISSDNVLTIRPHEIFIAKNELPNDRWHNFTIKPLFLRNKKRSNLCPVWALQDYLSMTSRIKSGPLFIDPNNNKDLTKDSLSKLISALICKSDPSYRPKMHDIRKFAANLALMQSLDFKQVQNAIRWRSPNTFFRYYILPLNKPSVPAAVPGPSSCIPEEEADEAV